MRLKEAFSNNKLSQEKLPMKTVQKQINQRKPLSHKFIKKAGQAFLKSGGRLPADVHDRSHQSIPPKRNNKVAK